MDACIFIFVLSKSESVGGFAKGKSWRECVCVCVCVCVATTTSATSCCSEKWQQLCHDCVLVCDGYLQSRTPREDNDGLLCELACQYAEDQHWQKIEMDRNRDWEIIVENDQLCRHNNQLQKLHSHLHYYCIQCQLKNPSKSL